MAKKRRTGPATESPYPAGQKSSKGMKYSSNGPGKVASKPGNPRTGMGVKVGKHRPPVQGGSASGITAGRARTNRGRNSTGSGPQGMRG